MTEKNVDKMIHIMKKVYTNHLYGTEEATNEVRKYDGTCLCYWGIIYIQVSLAVHLLEYSEHLG